MSFGDWWVRERNAVEATVSAAWAQIEPEVKALAISAVQSGVTAALAKGGTVGDQFVAARNAAEAIVTSQGKTVAADVLHALTAGAVATANNPPAP